MGASFWFQMFVALILSLSESIISSHLGSLLAVYIDSNFRRLFQQTGSTSKTNLIVMINLLSSLLFFGKFIKGL